MEQFKIEFNNRFLKQSPYLTTSHRTGTMSWSRTITGSPTRCAEEEGALWSIVVVCRETISAIVKNASCVWETMSCAGGMSTLGIWARGVGICGLASLCLLSPNLVPF